MNTFPQSVEIHPDGEVIYRQRVWGSFSQPLELSEFPFDTQRLEITLANLSFGSQKVRLKPSPDSGISENLSIPDWVIMQWDFAAEDLRLDNESSLTPGMVFLSMVEVVYTAHLSTNNRLEKARVIDRKARWIAPLIYMVLTAEALIVRFWN